MGILGCLHVATILFRHRGFLRPSPVIPPLAHNTAAGLRTRTIGGLPAWMVWRRSANSSLA